jgi:hypothetical protein
MAHCWLHREGFCFLEHKKVLYYDGHEHPDVVHYCQNIFLPQMEKYRPRLVEYQTGDMNKQVEKNCPDNSQPWLVLLAQDESTAQQNDGKKASLVYEGEHALKRKVLEGGFTRVMLSARLLAGSRMQVRALNMARITKGIGLEKCLSNRWDFINRKFSNKV